MLVKVSLMTQKTEVKWYFEHLLRLFTMAPLPVPSVSREQGNSTELRFLTNDQWLFGSG